MKFKIIGEQIVGNEIMESGATIVLGEHMDIENTKSITYNGLMRVGHLQGLANSMYTETMYKGLRFIIYDWKTENCFSYSLYFPEIIGYEKDTNNTLIIVEKYNEI